MNTAEKFARSVCSSQEIDDINKSEDRIQMCLVKYIDFKHPTAFYYHVPNGGKRNKREAFNFKLMGVKAGIPDLVFAEPRGKYHGMYLELKDGDGRVSKDQKVTLSELSNRGYYTATARDVETARDYVEYYLGLK